MTVIDVHLHWCGPCVVMYQNYRTIWYNYEEADKRLEFYTVRNMMMNFYLIDGKHPHAKGVPR